MQIYGLYKKDLWKKIFFICLGIFAGTAFCMKWMENDLVYREGKFTITGLEFTYTKEKILSIFSGLDDKTRTILRYHLSFDFAFMPGAYGCIAALCMMAAIRNDSRRITRAVLLILALLQIVAWASDISENIFLLRWIKTGIPGDEFGLYHLAVYTKWTIAFAGILMASVSFVLNSRYKEAPKF